MDKLLRVILSLIGVVTTLFMASTVNGTILWLLYDQLHILFPKAADNGIIAKELGWWNSVCLTWLIVVTFSGIAKVSKD